jgi:hypothetical protein
MIAIRRKPMSGELRARFDEKVAVPGRRWLEAHHADTANGRPPDYWREVLPNLADAFHRRCAYTAMWLNCDGTVDHFVSIDEDRRRAYEWDNFRYCAGWFNSKKQHMRSADLLDPLCVEDGWFELSWPDLQLRISEACPPAARSRAERMLEDLDLRDGRRVIENRRAYRDLFFRHGVEALPQIEEQAPLVARAIRENMPAGGPAPDRS